jgi:hypothetical protein
VRSHLVAGVAALAWVGCSGGKTCVLVPCHSTVTFALATPLPGRTFSILIGPPEGGAERLDCQTGDGAVACVPADSPLVPTFTADGALESVRVSSSSTGKYAVQITVDGTAAAGGFFDYIPTYDPVTPGECAPAAYCPSSETFTLGN